ncbi:TspO/MBR family protein [Actinocorallia sp. B10E7]|uniref:TspO/MBR family protein n=1 Tax=Actinocorallia sp. B10E7 TaxID=3153558 RepID=UPI00325E1913
MKTLLKISLVALPAAGVGSLAADTNSAWYRALRKPSWQPSAMVFPVVWTPLYGLIAYAGSRAMDRASEPERRALARDLGGSLLLSAGWSCLFFGTRSPRSALGEIAWLNLFNLALVRRAWRVDRGAGLLIAPFAVWTLVTTGLNGTVVWLNR